MNPERKFHSIIISITTAIIFATWLLLIEIIKSNPFLSVILGGLISIGIYRSLVLLFLTFFRNIRWFKKIILGPYFMEGTWAGYFIGNKNQIRFFVETFEQNLSKLVIRGKSYKEDNGFHGSWIAETTNIDILLGKLSYKYQTDAIDNTFINPGIAEFVFERSSSHKPPIILIGFSSDLYNPKKLIAIEEKISNKTMYDFDAALDNAKKVYERNKNRIK